VIDEKAFSNCKCIKTLKISEGVEHIKNGAFSDCRALERISLPESLKTVGENAFAANIALREITVLSKYTEFDEYALVLKYSSDFNHHIPDIRVIGYVNSAAEALAEKSGAMFVDIEAPITEPSTEPATMPETEPKTEPATEPSTDAVTDASGTVPPSDARNGEKNGVSVTVICIGAAVLTAVAVAVILVKKKK
ncbi:MAG: leucine-rich repeat protein, partial [Clostridia bacterium]|nr:leucine-rich repeat protein [Clostridia bacterium]